jgi:crotonobetainyl-CoA:carnitine CoA-transferase CaiB-like acyl-CoA transferase
MVQVVEHPERGPMEILGNPIRIDHEHTVLKPSPLLGEHTAEVLACELGLGADEIGELRAACVI